MAPESPTRGHARLLTRKSVDTLAFPALRKLSVPARSEIAYLPLAIVESWRRVRYRW